jgi:hypothetical protein
MIWTVLLVLLISVISLLVILLSLILFPVITFGISAALRPSQKMVLIQGSWLHPRVVTFSFDLLNRKMNLTFLSLKLVRERTFDKKQKRDTSHKDTTVKPPGPASKKVESEIVVSPKLPEVEQSNQHRLRQDREDVRSDEQQKLSCIKDETGDSRPEAINDEDRARKARETEKSVEETFEVGIEEKVEAKGEVKVKVKEKAKTKEKEKEKEKEEKVDEKKEGLFLRLKRNRYFYMIRQDKLFQKLFRWVFRVFKALFRIIHFDHFNTSIKAGIEEPALLGKIYALYTMARSTLNVSNGKPAIEFEPVFMQNCFEGDTAFRLKTSVIVLLWPGVIALTTFPYFTVLWLFWKSRKLNRPADFMKKTV